MDCILGVIKEGRHYTFFVPARCGYFQFFVDGKVCIDFHFKHSHAFGFAAYCFEDRSIYSLHYYRSKKEMIGAVQNLLENKVNK